MYIYTYIHIYVYTYTHTHTHTHTHQPQGIFDAWGRRLCCPWIPLAISGNRSCPPLASHALLRLGRDLGKNSENSASYYIYCTVTV